MKKTNMINAVRSVQHDAESRVLLITGMSKEEMFWFKVDQCIAYFQSKAPKDVDFLLNKKIIWNWWLNQWAVRDLQFIEKYGNSKFSTLLKKKYLLINDIDSLTISPRKLALEKSLVKTLKTVVKNEERSLKDA
ncbi:hypothetical protein [Sphingobacterium spiritivorum]|uniref:hypothetical protein n=1 Tax=Sphingobacterium spiritivorum TaxID=258 RepID=UPI003DA2C7FC